LSDISVFVIEAFDYSYNFGVV